MGWGAFLVALAGPVARRVLISLGVSLVTYAGVSTAVNAMLGSAKAAYAGSMGATAAQLIAMSGVNVALSILSGAIIGRVSMLAVKKFQAT